MKLSINSGEIKDFIRGNFFRYVLIGGSTATLDLIVFLFLYNTLNVDPTVATIISTSVGIVSSFLLNAFLNFKKRDKLFKRFILFYLVGVVGLVISAVVIYIAHGLLMIDANIAKIISIPLVVIAQFTLNKRFSFSDDPDKDYKKLKIFLRSYYKVVLLILVCAFFFFSAVYMNVTRDDIDNMLGGKLILEGVLPYTGFFSHHAPGMYFLSALIYPFTQNDVFIYRIIFNILTFGILLLTSYILSKLTSSRAAVLYLILMSVGHLIALSHVPLGESLIAQILPLLVVLIFLRKANYFSQKQIALLSVLLFLIPFMSLAYIFSIGVLYLIIVVNAYKQAIHLGSFKLLLQSLVLLALPYGLMLAFFILTGSLSTIYADLFKFNSEYYAPMTGEQGGGVLSALGGIIISNIRQVITIVTNVFNIEYMPQVLILAGFIYFMWYLWQRKRKLEVALVPMLFILLNTRTNIFNAPAMTTQIDSLQQHAAPYISVALLVGAVGVIAFIASNQSRAWYSRIFKLIAALYLLVIPYAVFNVWLQSSRAVFIAKTEPNYSSYARDLPTSSHVTIMNDLTSDKETVWIGPADFPSQLYVNAGMATRFSFYMPWMDSSPQLRKEFVASIADERPKIIAFSDFKYKSQVYNYSDDLKSILENKYFQIEDNRLRSYYFDKQEKVNIINKLDRLGYETK